MGKYSQASQEFQKWNAEYINKRWEQLHKFQKEIAGEIFKFLFLINAGGAAATLSFIGAIGKDKISCLGKMPLIFFVVGIILVGVARARQIHQLNGLFGQWKINVDKYYKDEIDWDEMIRADEDKAKANFFDYAFPYTSFGSFIVGCVLGLLAVM